MRAPSDLPFLRGGGLLAMAGVALATTGCNDDEVIDTGPPPFAVVSVDPTDGGGMSTEVSPVQLILSADPDLSRCNADTIRVDALRADGAVAFTATMTLDLQGEGNLKVQPIDPYVTGYTYAVTVRGGDDGCADVEQRNIQPFYSTFEVP